MPEGPVVLVGHSMGGMAIVAFAEQHPELFGDRIVGVGLVSTTAGGLDPGRILLPMLPAKLGGELTSRTVRTLARRHRLVDGVRRAGRSVATVATDLFAFGDEVPAAYVDFVDRMLSDTPFEVVAEFFPSFRGAGQVRLGRDPRPGADHGHLRHRGPAHLDRPQPQAARADPGLDRCSSARARATWSSSSGTARSTPPSTSSLSAATERVGHR